ncbi:tRNA (adenosine(37)-N6)-threonylcarbamoyltransferase complex ATPase subunit type 1 TsaE [Nitratireductor sp. ZSWI3]|uniref:tRNA (adenosine(37)-N6)-threonylcarbamoyltransferase complex ATPase subunit type 1 TsaE n=1 Tax=Nitratireductor sp. ZSWI3 TaxID=2966359 RepID=UPI00215049C7|nr:tRNA (adenosine(37)-N6)-threonylcarbamoyltransferase complex ATPase subunit type 1 TsaE [Nitratireductor sp. ZSWI3]MCR4265700.1 tRNA (adenosine(37)-N6)-threonylcarbamoyltransferase complex ATPase subunit type 1 TsaE [Nitratireductor sp. ZSWI3]
MSARVLERFLPDEEATALFGEDIAVALKSGDVLALKGDLGAGKTTLARAIIRALAGNPELDVPSPTFTLTQSYDARLPVHHFDLYRLADPDELEELGLAEAAENGVALVEWPERAGAALADAIRLELHESGEGRLAVISAPQEAMLRLERSFAIRDFLNKAGELRAHRAFLLGDASLRAYETVATRLGEKRILMNAPERRDEPLLPSGRPYSRTAHLAQSVSASVAMAKAMRARGFSAYDVYAQDLEAGLLLVEHLGDVPFLSPEGEPVAERYLEAARLLAAIHEADWPADLPVAEGVSHHLPLYDREALGIEVSLLTDWYMPFMAGRPASEAERQGYMERWERLFARLEQFEQNLVLRDFHSPNLIWRAERHGFDRLGLIDLQDAVRGPAAYDVASLALDARVTMPEDLERQIVEAYCAARREQGAFDRAAFDEAYAICATQRNSKLLGTFVRLEKRDHKPFYIRHLPRIRTYLRRAMRHPALAELKAFYDEAGFLREDEA